MKLTCLLAVTLLGCLADAQYAQKQQLAHQQHAQQQHGQQQHGQLPHQQVPNRYTPATTKQATKNTETFHSCEVAEHFKVQCGAPAITGAECEAINCCYDGRMCYYGKSVTLQCTKDGQFIVVVARDATLPNIDLESVSFLGSEGTCSPVGTTAAFAIYQFPVTACGTVMTEEPGVIIYENRMSSYFEIAVGPYGIITRDSHYELLVQCRYIGVTVEALLIEVGLVPPPPPVAAPGPLRVELRLANGQCNTKGCVEEDVAFSSFYQDSDYPVSKVLREPVYAEIRILERTDPNIVLTLGRCWATSNPYPHSVPQWDLLIDGCPYRDDNYLTTLVPVDASSGLAFPTHYRRFIFKMFTFVANDGGGANPMKGGKGAKGAKGGADPDIMTPLKEKVYIHCDTAVCQPSLGSNCEPRCFRKKRDIAASAIEGTQSETVVASSKEIIFTSA